MNDGLGPTFNRVRTAILGLLLSFGVGFAVPSQAVAATPWAGFLQHELMDSTITPLSLSGYAVFDHAPPGYGVLPLHYDLKSPKIFDGELALQSTMMVNYNEAGSLSKNWPLKITATTQSFEILALVIPINNPHYGHGFFHTKAVGFGATEGPSGPWNPAVVALAITKEYAKIKGRNLKDALNTKILATRSRSYGGSDTIAEFSPEDLTQDPDQLLGWQDLIITERELDALGEPRSEHRALALEQFLKRGGQLWVIDEPQFQGRNPASWQALLLSDTTQPKFNIQSQYAVGMGSIYFQALDDMEWDTMNSLRVRSPLMPGAMVSELYASKSSSLKDRVPSLNSSVLGFLLMVVIFAFVVGPINLWVFCRGNRLRLILTTPIISICSALIFTILIIAMEGLGGEGARSQVRYVDPLRHQEIFQQVQLSRTGVMLSTGFELPEGVHLWPVYLDPSIYKLSREASFFSLVDSWAAKGWFSSRNLQAQLFQGSAPSRGKVEWRIKAEGPVVLSTLEQSCETLWVITKDKVYSAQSVRPGQEAPLVACEEENLLRVDFANFYPHIQACAQKGQAWFIAVSKDSNHFVPSLDSLRWKPHQTLWLGPIADVEKR